MSFFEKYVLLNVGDYIADVDFPLGPFVLALAVGTCLALFIGCARKRADYLLLRALIKSKAIGEENAKSLDSLGLSGNRSVVSLLRSPGKTASLVKRVGEEALTPEEYASRKQSKTLPTAPNPKECTYYLTEETQKKAKDVYAAGAPSRFRALLLSVLVLALAFGLLLLLPVVLPVFA